MVLDILVEVLRAEDTFARPILDAVLVADQHTGKTIKVRVFSDHVGILPQVAP